MIVLVVVIFAKGGAPTTGIDFSVFSFDGRLQLRGDQRRGRGVPVLGGLRGVRVDGRGDRRSRPQHPAGAGRHADPDRRAVRRRDVRPGRRIRHRRRRARGVPEFGKHVGRLGQHLRRPVVQPADHLHRDRVGVRLPPGDARRRRAGCSTRSAATASARRRWRRSTRAPAVRAAPPGWWSASRWWSTCICGAFGWPDMGTGNPAIDTYFLFAVAGSVCLMVCYLLVETRRRVVRRRTEVRRTCTAARARCSVWCCRCSARW